MLTDTHNSPYAKVTPLPCGSVHWTEGFWADAEDNNTKNTVPHLQKMFESKEISHVLENFRICAGDAEGSFDGTVFGDGDFYKWMESAVYSAALNGNTGLLDKLDEYIDLIGRAQLDDGYISTKQIIGERENNGISRLGDINDFEVYNFGHMFTAACLHKRLTGKDNFLDIAKKAAGYLENLYEESAKTGEVQTAVCPSHYMGLMEMYRTTGEKRYLDLAALAIRLRDSVKDGLDDNQDRIPLKEHRKIIGHAVRANYLYAGVADLCLETGDAEYMDVLHSVWDNLIRQKLYITGGCGALYNGASPYGQFFIHQLVHQAYGYEYQLPNVTAYNETCASVGSVLWAYRMFQLEPKAEYFDLIERTMLNTNLAAVSLDGKKYFYENMLRRAKELPYELIWPLTRSEYILSYCCPPNLARTIAESSEYAYTISENALWTGMYGANTASVRLPSGTSFRVEQKTSYPYDGNIRFLFSEICGEGFELKLRIPGWAVKGAVTSDGKTLELRKEDAGTYIAIPVNGKEASVDLYLDMPARYTVSHPLVEENTCQAAVERGPLVYCIETPDTGLDSLDDIMLNPSEELTPVSFRIGDREMSALEGNAWTVCRGKDYDPDALYQNLSFRELKETPIRMIPYFAWDNRGYGEMKVWLPVAYR